MSGFWFNKFTRERADQAAAMGTPVEARSADELEEDPKGQDPTCGTGEAGDIY
jgi:hypothetical protein